MNIMRMMRCILICDFFLALSATSPLAASGDAINQFLKQLNFEKLSDKNPPEFSLVTIRNDTVSLQSYRGKVLLLHFWATWCKPCMKELPELEQFYQNLGDKPVSVLAVSVDKSRDSLAVLQLVHKLGLKFSVAVVHSGQIPDVYWTWGVPVTYLIDQKGILRGRALGPRPWTDAKLPDLADEIHEKVQK